MCAIFERAGKCIGSNMALSNMAHKFILLFDRLATALPLALKGSPLTCRMTVQEFSSQIGYTVQADIYIGLTYSEVCGACGWMLPSAEEAETERVGFGPGTTLWGLKGMANMVRQERQQEPGCILSIAKSNSQSISGSWGRGAAEWLPE